jgi:hypothetical protein
MTEVATFSAGSARSEWSIPIKSTDGRTVYILSLNPEFWAGAQEVEGLDLVLRRSSEKRNATNLLAPTGNWHGLQSFNFPAVDFANGVEKSVFGGKRTIFVRRLGLAIEVEILKAKIGPTRLEQYELEELGLKIQIDNIPGVPNAGK